jgi:hypothetical protein
MSGWRSTRHSSKEEQGCMSYVIMTFFFYLFVSGSGHGLFVNFLFANLFSIIFFGGGYLLFRITKWMNERGL